MRSNPPITRLAVAVTMAGLMTACTTLPGGHEQQAKASDARDGSVVDITVPPTDHAEHPAVRIASPAPNATLTSEVEIRGEARGSWFFEATLPVAIVATNGTELASGVARADGEWMTNDFIAFDATLRVPDLAAKTDANVVVRRSNPSGLPRNDDEVRIPITLVPASYTAASDTDWNRYTNRPIGVAFDVPAAAYERDIAPGKAVAATGFMLWGPSQEPNTELYDGLSLTVRRVDRGETTLRDYVNDRIASIAQVGEIIAPLYTTPLAGHDALAFTVDTVGEVTHYYIGLHADTHIELSVLAPDPTGKGYAQMIDKMLSSMELL